MWRSEIAGKQTAEDCRAPRELRRDRRLVISSFVESFCSNEEENPEEQSAEGKIAKEIVEAEVEEPVEEEMVLVAAPMAVGVVAEKGATTEAI